MLPKLVICRQIYTKQNKAWNEIPIYLFFIEFIYIFWPKIEGFSGDSRPITNADWALESGGYSGVYGVL